MPQIELEERTPSALGLADPIAAFSNSYARLPDHFFARIDSTPVNAPRLIQFNKELASELGLQAASQ
jgi:serine/tyrosine/threonine adenylyltransferase